MRLVEQRPRITQVRVKLAVAITKKSEQLHMHICLHRELSHQILRSTSSPVFDIVDELICKDLHSTR